MFSWQMVFLTPLFGEPVVLHPGILWFSSVPCQEKKEHRPKLLGPDFLQWGGGLPREGVGVKKFGMSLETREHKLFGGISQDVAGIPR